MSHRTNSSTRKYVEDGHWFSETVQTWGKRWDLPKKRYPLGRSCHTCADASFSFKPKRYASAHTPFVYHLSYTIWYTIPRLCIHTPFAITICVPTVWYTMGHSRICWWVQEWTSGVFHIFQCQGPQVPSTVFHQDIPGMIRYYRSWVQSVCYVKGISVYLSRKHPNILPFPPLVAHFLGLLPLKQKSYKEIGWDI